MPGSNPVNPVGGSVNGRTVTVVPQQPKPAEETKAAPPEGNFGSMSVRQANAVPRAPGSGLSPGLAIVLERIREWARGKFEVMPASTPEAPTRTPPTPPARTGGASPATATVDDLLSNAAKVDADDLEAALDDVAELISELGDGVVSEDLESVLMEPDTAAPVSREDTDPAGNGAKADADGTSGSYQPDSENVAALARHMQGDFLIGGWDILQKEIARGSAPRGSRAENRIPQQDDATVDDDTVTEDAATLDNVGGKGADPWDELLKEAEGDILDELTERAEDDDLDATITSRVSAHIESSNDGDPQDRVDEAYVDGEYLYGDIRLVDWSKVAAAENAQGQLPVGGGGDLGKTVTETENSGSAQGTEGEDDIDATLNRLDSLKAETVLGQRDARVEALKERSKEITGYYKDISDFCKSSKDKHYTLQEVDAMEERIESLISQQQREIEEILSGFATYDRQPDSDQ